MKPRTQRRSKHRRKRSTLRKGGVILNLASRGNRRQNLNMARYYVSQGYTVRNNNGTVYNSLNNIPNANNNVEEVKENNEYTVPHNINSLNTIELPDKVRNEISFEDINFERPVLVLNEEEKLNLGSRRVFQTNFTVKNIKNTRKNPFTRMHVSSVKWMKPTRANKK
jgi:signal peptidase I